MKEGNTAVKAETPARATIKTLPGDDVRQIMWRYSDRYDLQMVVQSTRQVARGVIARLVAEGARNTHEWTEDKGKILEAFDEAGITAAFMDPEQGGYIEGAKNMVLSLIAFELAWVDGGAATCSLATNLALAPIHERGTKEQRDLYMKRCVPANQLGPDGKPHRGAFVLTEPLPFIGADTGMVGGKARIAEWKDGQEPVLQIDKRGRFITNMDFATFVTAAVASDDPKIKGTFMVIMEETDPGVYDRGAVTKKLVHQLSSTRDPIFSMKIPASRIIGGYTVKDGVIIPNYDHSAVIESVFLRTRIAPGVMSSAKLLSAVEPVIRYQRQRFHGGDAGPGSPRYELGLQMKEDALHRLADVWAAGEAAASLGFLTSRAADEFEPVEKARDTYFAEKGITGSRAQMKAIAAAEKTALEYLSLLDEPEDKRNNKRLEELRNDVLTQFVVQDSVFQIYCPACKLWNTGEGTNMMRQAVSLMGGYGITEDCPGFLANKWMDAQLEATYEGPEAVQRRHLTVTMTNQVFLAQMKRWVKELRKLASDKPGTGACALAKAMELWLWTVKHCEVAKDADGKALYHGKRQAVTFALADALSWIVAAKSFIDDLQELELKGPENSNLADGLEGFVNFFTDLSHVQCAHTATRVGALCNELVFGYNRHPAWDAADKSCCSGQMADGMESTAAGMGAEARAMGNVIEIDGTHQVKAGPCACTCGLEDFTTIKGRLDTCITGARLAKDRAAEALTQIMIPAALDYPM